VSVRKNHCNHYYSPLHGYRIDLGTS